MCKVSVIMPSLNVAHYIEECINSVISQTLKDIEIICVDAGSNDGTYEILESYAKDDSRIRIIRSDKKSYGYQMNLGILSAKGEYIGIVETDDFVSKDMFKSLYEHAVDIKADFVKSNHYMVKGERGNYSVESVPLLRDPKQYGLYTDHDLKELFRAKMHTWTGLYRREFLTENRILHNETPGAAYQDNGFWFQTIMFAKRVRFVDEAYYFLRRDNPESSFFAKDKIDAIKKEYDFIRDIIISSDLSNKRELLEYCFYYRFVNYTGQQRRIADEDMKEYYGYLTEDVDDAISRNEINHTLFRGKQTIYLMCAMLHSRPVRYEGDDVFRVWSEYTKDSAALGNRYYLHLFRLDKKIEECKRLFIYGAGKIGQKIYRVLRDMGYDEKVKAFVVTQKDATAIIFGLPVIEVVDLVKNEFDQIIVAVGYGIRDEVEDELRRKGIREYIYFDPTGMKI